ncbi:hypothetical protein [Thiohalorhabdus methylotrophus]|uniref:Uncharacterized protein n=1 Tax=Thiohalorhabdus methylotrophus TaxID=3242694 RepID=A0ABV4TX29_9GAMM
MSCDPAEVVIASDAVTRRVCEYLRACGVTDPKRQIALCRRVRSQMEARTPYSGDMAGEVPFRSIQPLIDEALADEAGLSETGGGRGLDGCQPRLLRGGRRMRPAFRNSFTWEGPTPVPVKMHPQDLSAFPSLRRIGIFIPRPATSWSWVTMGSLAFIIMALW